MAQIAKMRCAGCKYVCPAIPISENLLEYYAKKVMCYQKNGKQEDADFLSGNLYSMFEGTIIIASCKLDGKTHTFKTNF